MSGVDLPYRLRPAKYVDRELFAELIGQIVSLEGRDDWIYVSMAGEHLVDIQSIYRRSGISKFYTFDIKQDVVDRQRFNRNLPSIQFERHASTELADRLDEIVDAAGVENVIIWLDFTGAGRRKDQIDDFVAILKKLSPGDICRLTLDAGHYFFVDLRDRWAPKDLANAPLHERLAAGFRDALAPYSDPSVAALDKTDLASELIACVGRACPMAADRPADIVRFVPLLLTHYGDGSTMVTVTVRCESESEPLTVPGGWEWQPTDWTQVQTVRADVLSAKERALIDARLDDIDDACSKLDFLEEEAVRSYARFHRFQPNFQNVTE